jgi:sugar lactone lactonase YvrE
MSKLCKSFTAHLIVPVVLLGIIGISGSGLAYADIVGTARMAGTVTAENPFIAAKVYARNLDKDMLYMVYTADGHYTTINLMPGGYEVWAEKDGLKSEHTKLRIEAEVDLRLNFSLKPGPDYPLTFRSRVKEGVLQISYDEMYPAGPGKEILERTCMACHGQAFLPPRKMNKVAWIAIIDLMLNPDANRGAMIQEGAGVGTITAKERDVLADYLANNFGPDSPDRVLKIDVEYPLDEQALSKAMFIEYLMPLSPDTDITARASNQANGRHRVIEPHIDNTGNIWATNSFIGLSKLDPRTAEYEHYPYGLDHRNPDPNILGHGLTVDSENNVFWIEFFGRHVGRLDPATGKMDRFPIDASGEVRNVQGHTPGLDSKENVWFTVITGNKIGKWDRATEEVSLFEIPTANSFPYGMDMDENDEVWFAELFGCKVGRFNTRTEQFTEYPALASPCAMNRLTVDADGIVWYSLVRTGKLGKLNPTTGEQVEYDILPFRSESKVVASGPYGIISDQNGHIWFGDHGLGGALIRFDPNSETFTYYPDPRQTDHPNIDITGEGAIVYTTRSNWQSAIGIFYPDVSKMTSFGAFR